MSKENDLSPPWAGCANIPLSDAVWLHIPTDYRRAFNNRGTVGVGAVEFNDAISKHEGCGVRN